MDASVHDAKVSGYEELIDALVLPDPDDRHVLAAAIKAGANAIVTFNLKDFPGDASSKYGIEAIHPDEFVYSQIGLAPAIACGAMVTGAEVTLISLLVGRGMVTTVNKLVEAKQY